MSAEEHGQPSAVERAARQAAERAAQRIARQALVKLGTVLGAKGAAVVTAVIAVVVLVVLLIVLLVAVMGEVAIALTMLAPIAVLIGIPSRPVSSGISSTPPPMRPEISVAPARRIAR